MEQQKERGSFTIEAILSLSIFMFAFVTIISLATVAKIESTTQYAIDQVAKEISRYCYIASRANLLANPSDGTAAKVDNIDDAIQSMYDFTDILDQATDGGSTNSADLSTRIENLSQMNSDDFIAVSDAAQDLYGSFDTLLDDPKGSIAALAQVFSQKASSAVVSRVIAQPLCQTLIPKYITSNGDANETLKKMGLEDGLEELDFSMSTFLMDGRTINIVVVYEIKINGFGIFDQTIVVKQTASTAAWLADTEGNKLSDVSASISNWQKADLERGKVYVSTLKKENPRLAVKAGVGVDLYDQSTNTFKSVHSVNVFAATYSDYQKSGTDNVVDNYTLKKSKIKSVVKGYAKNLQANVKKIDEMITMEDGTECQTAKNGVKTRASEIILVVPKEAGENSDNVAILNEIASEIEAETGVKVSITYRDSALGG